MDEKGDPLGVVKATLSTLPRSRKLEVHKWLGNLLDLESHNPGIDQIREIVNAWNEIPGVVKCASVTSKRREKIAARWRETFFKAHWKEAIEKAKKSAFLRGENDRKWKADIDWFLRPDSVTKIVEGKYDRPWRKQGENWLEAKKERHEEEREESHSGIAEEDRPSRGTIRPGV